jgi:hypothetical protein
MKKREPEFVLVPATTFRERKNFWNKPRTYEQILAQEKAAAERKAAAEAARASEVAAEEAAFQLKKAAAEEGWKNGQL